MSGPSSRPVAPLDRIERAGPGRDPARARTLRVGWRALRVGWRALRLGAETVVSDRSGLAGRSVFYLMVTAALSSLWWAAIAANGGTVAGYSGTAIVWYVAVAESVVLAVPNNLMEQVSNEITSQRLVAVFNRPVAPLAAMVGLRVGEALPAVVTHLAMAVVLGLMVAGPPSDPWASAWAVPSALLAVAIAVVMHHVVGSLAFRIGDVSGLWLFYQKLGFLLGGLVLPLEILPDRLEAVARALPFAAIIYTPARMAAGRFEPIALAVQLGWLVGLSGLAWWAFSRGEERLCRAR